MIFLRRVCLLACAGLPGIALPLRADTERLVDYYRQLLAQEPENVRAREFLQSRGFLPGGEAEGETARVANAAPEDPRAAIRQSWAGENPAAAREELLAWWEKLPATARLQAGYWALQHAPAAELPWIAAQIDRTLAPEDPRRREVAALLGEHLDRSPASLSLAEGWRARLQDGATSWVDPVELVTATVWLARHGEEEAWLRALVRAAELEPDSREPVAAAVAALAIRPAWQTDFLRWSERWEALEPGSFDLLLFRVENALLQNDEAGAEALLEGWMARYPENWTAARRAQARALADRLHWREGRHLILARPATGAAPAWTDIRDLVESHLRWLEPNEALATAQAWLDHPGDANSPAERAEQAGTLADLFLRLQDPASALPFGEAAWEAARASDDASLREKSLLRLSELHQLGGDPATARTVLEEWLSRDDTILPPASLDRRLFDLHERSADRTETAGEDSPTPDSSLAVAESLPGKPGVSPGMKALLETLRARQQSDAAPEVRETATLRLARFLRWARQPQAASLAYQRGLLDFPESIALHEDSISLAMELLDLRTARAHREELIRLDPDRAEEHRRLLALLLLEMGETGSALDLFQALREARPESAAVWIDQARALQAAEQRFAALELLFEGLQAAPNEEFRLELWPEAWQAAQRVGRTEALTEWLEAHRATLPEAEAGRWEEQTSPTLLAESLSTEAPAPTSTESAKTPDSWNDPALTTFGARDAALWLAAAPDPANPEAFSWWERAAERFPRHPGILRRAARAAQAVGQPRRAAPWLTRAVELEPPAAESLLEAARLHFVLGNRLEALQLLETVLLIPPGATPPGRPLFPEFPALTSGERQQAARLVFRVRGHAGPWNRARAALVQESHPATQATPQLEAHRIAAIQALSELARQTRDTAAWRDRWLALPNLPEKIHGLLALGEADAALEVLAEAVRNSPRDYAALRAFFELALEMGKLGPALDLLAASGDEIPERTDLFLSALSKRAQDSPFDRTEELATALQEHPGLASLRWPMAQLLAHREDPAAATRIGEPALAHMPPEALPTAQLDFVSWILQSHDPAAAAEFLKQQTIPAAEGFQDPALALQRIRWVLATPVERIALREEAEKEAAEGSADGALRLFLYTALERDQPEALAGPAAALVAKRSAEAFAQRDPHALAGFLRAGADQLLQWRLPTAAQALLQAGLGADEAMLSLREQLDTYQRAELQMMSLALQIEETPPSAWAGLLTSWWNDHPDRDFFLALAGRLEMNGRPAAALVALELLAATGWELPALPESGLRVARQSGDAAALLRWLQIATTQNPPNDPAREKELAALTVEALLANGEFATARAYLTEALRRFPDDPTLFEKNLQLAREEGDAAAVTALLRQRWEKELTIAHGLALLDHLWQSGFWEEAAPMWWELHASSPQSLAEWGERAAQTAFPEALLPEAVQWLLDRLPGEPWLPPLAHLRALLRTGSWPSAGAWLARHASSEEWADLLLETARHPGVPSEILTTAWMATQNFPRPELSAFWKARGELARRLEKTEEWREQLAAEWRSGEGPLWAAEMLLQLPPEELTPALRLQILGQFLAREPSPAALAGLADWLEKNDNFASALPVRREHLRRFPQDGEARLRLARLEWLCGQAADARLTLEPWTRTAELFPELLPTLLETALARDNWPEVRFWAERGLRFGLPPEQRRFLVAKATACARLGDWGVARELFAEACALAGSPSPAPLLDLWLDQNPTLLEELRPLLRAQDDFLFATLRARRLAAEARWGELALWFSHNPSLAHHPGLAPLRNRLEEIARSAPPEEPDASNPSLEAGRR